MTTADRLAEFCGVTTSSFYEHWQGTDGRWHEQRWDPEHDRNHLAIVLTACEDQGLLPEVQDRLWRAWTRIEHDCDCPSKYGLWLLTIAPATICQAVIAVLDERGL